MVEDVNKLVLYLALSVYALLAIIMLYYAILPFMSEQPVVPEGRHTSVCVLKDKVNNLYTCN